MRWVSDNSGVEFRAVLSNYYDRMGRKRIKKHNGCGFVLYSTVPYRTSITKPWNFNTALQNRKSCNHKVCILVDSIN